MVFVCLSVCLLATSLKNYCSDLHENITRDVSVNNEELVKFWNFSTSGSRCRNFLKDSSACEIGHFAINWFVISGKTDQVFVHI